MRSLTTRRTAALLFGVGLALAPWTAEAGARSGRGGGGGGGGGTAPRVATRSTHAGPSAAHASGARSAPRTASGKATYGYYSHGYYGGGYPGYGYGGYYPYYPYYGYGWDYWPSWSVGVQIGWPYWGGWGSWGYPYGYGYPYAYPYPYGYAYEQGEPAPVGPASVEIDATPRNARVILNGEDIGRAKDYDGRWDRLRIGAGRQVLELKADGYKTLRVVIDADGGRSYHLNYTLEGGEGLDARSQDPAAMPPPQDARPERTAEEDAASSARLEKGFLRLTVTPPDAAIYLDGEYFARGDEVARLRGAIPLAVGTHRIEVVRPGFASETVEVQVDRGATASAAVVLEGGN